MRARLLGGLSDRMLVSRPDHAFQEQRFDAAPAAHGYRLRRGGSWGLFRSTLAPSLMVPMRFGQQPDETVLRVPMYGPGQPYYPFGTQAVTEALWGIIDDTASNIEGQLHVSLRESRGWIAAAGHQAGQLVVELAEETPGGLRGMDVHMT